MTLRKTEPSVSQGDRAEKLREQAGGLLPDRTYLARFFANDHERTVVLPLLDRALLKPLEEFLARPSKIIRAALVHSGFEAASSGESMTPSAYRAMASYQPDLQVCSHVIELLHSGSLIIDDLQDESLTRRGKDCFHRLHGPTLAVTAGNWLYVWPLKMMRQLDISDEQIHDMQECYHLALETAHYGQALDVSVVIDKLEQAEISALCQWVTRHKTGAITVLALELGAILGGADQELLERLRRFGMEFGTLLQNYDDLGNMLGHQEPAKRFEDLIHRRPSWVWAMVADHYPATSFKEFSQAVDSLPADHLPLITWLDRYQFVELAAEKMERRLAQLKQLVIQEVDPEGTKTQKVLIELSERLSHVYTKVLEEHRSHR